MAPAKEAVGSSQEALLQLEKDTAGSAIELNNAAQILGIDLTLCASSHGAAFDLQYFQIESAPKEEWVLRWLLKRLKIKSYRLDPASFVLFEWLLHRVPRRAIAVTLTEYKFLTVFKDIVIDLEQCVFDLLRDRNGGLHAERSDSESSHTLGGSPVRKRPGTDIKGGRKRKRTEATSPEPKPSMESAVIAYLRFLNFLHSLMSLVHQTTDHDTNSQLHLQQALRTEADFAGSVLGRMLRLSARLLIELSTKGKGAEIQSLLHGTTAVFGIWDLNKSNINNSASNAGNVAFSEHGFLQALRLQRAIHSTESHSEDADFIIHSIDRLIALHVVIPARNGFMTRGGSGIDYSKAGDPDWSAVKPVTDTFQPLLEDRPGDFIDFGEITGHMQHFSYKGQDRNPIPAWKPAELLPSFFDIVIRSVPRNTFRRQTTEASWLETVFVALAELAFSSVKKVGPAGDTSRFVPILEQLFTVVSARNVKLSLHTILTHAGHTGLLKDGLEKVHWNLTALLVELGVDIFLPNSGFSDSRRLLDALLGKILFQWASDSNTSCQKHQTIKSAIVIPLLQGLAAARDWSTFVQIWRDQLIKVETARTCGLGTIFPLLKSTKLRANDYKSSIWESDDLIHAYREVMKTSLTGTQLNLQIQTAISTMEVDSGRVSSKPESYAQAVILEAGSTSWGQNLPSDLIVSSVAQLVKAIKATLLSGTAMHWRWRLWRLASHFVGRTNQSYSKTLDSLALDLRAQAVKVIKGSYDARHREPGDFRETLEACRFLLQTIQALDHEGVTDLPNDLLDSIVGFLQLLQSSGNESVEWSWNGQIESVDSSVALGTAFVVSILRTPELWPKVQPRIQKAFIGHLLSLAANAEDKPTSSTTNAKASDTNFSHLWNILVSYDYLVNVPLLCDSVGSVLSDRLEKNPELSSFVIRSLLRVPTHVFDSRQQVRILSLLRTTILEPSLSVETCAEAMSMMAKWERCPERHRPTDENWNFLLRIAKMKRPRDSDKDLRMLRSFRSLIRAETGPGYSDLNSDMRTGTLRKIHDDVTDLLGLVQVSKDCTSLEFVLARGALWQLWEWRDEIEDKMRVKKIARQRQKLFKLILGELESAQRPSHKSDIGALNALLEALDDFEDFVQESTEAREHLKGIERTLEEASVGPGRPLQRLIRRQVVSDIKSTRSVSLKDEKLARELPLQHLHAEEQERFVQETSSKFQLMSNDQRLQAIRDLQDAGFGGANASYSLLLAGLAVSTLSEIEERGSTAAQDVSSLCTAVTGAMQKSTSLEEFSLAAECLDLILRSHPRAVSQWNIDHLLSSVSSIIVTSSSFEDRLMSSDSVDTVYVRSCRLLGRLFGLYRQQLGGRYHLIVPTLQNLMAALFAPTRKRQRRHDHPVVPNGQSRLHSPLTASHAVHFSRLLSSLCDPTVSAVSRPGQAGPGRDALVDQTKRAKHIAGQHLRILVQSYTRCMLDTPAAPEIRAALAPGLYAVLDAMAPETKRALNASLDVSSRAIFKTLHEDYTKFGKWNNRG